MAADDLDIFSKEDARLDAVLFEDLQTASAKLAREDSQFLRRAYCRCLLSMFDGVVARLKKYTLIFYDGVLGEGEKKQLQNRLGALESAFHAFDLYTNVAGAETPLERNKEEWLVLKKAVSIRNRVTHPSSADDLEISELDMVHLRIAERVMLDLIRRCLKDCARALDKRQKEIRRAWEQHHGVGGGTRG